MHMYISYCYLLYGLLAIKYVSRIGVLPLW